MKKIWYCAKNKKHLNRIYRRMVFHIRKAANECGYAIGVHGSMMRDLDLIAVPWIENPKPSEFLAKKIAESVCKYGYFQDADKWQDRPHGRKARTIAVGFNTIIDLSVVPFIEPNPSGEKERK